MDVSQLNTEEILKKVEENFSSVFTKEDVLLLLNRVIETSTRFEGIHELQLQIFWLILLLRLLLHF
jgi:hypothetical protein